LPRAVKKQQPTTEPPVRPADQQSAAHSSIGSASDLLSFRSLVWDDAGEQLDQTIGRRRWSTTAQLEASLVQPQAEGGASDGGGSQILTALLAGNEQETGESRDISILTAIEVLQPANSMETVEQARDQLERALLEIEDDILPFADKELTGDCMVELKEKAVKLKKVLQDCHLYLNNHDEEEYVANNKDNVAENRRLLAGFIVNIEQQRRAYEKDAAAELMAARLVAREDDAGARRAHVSRRAAQLLDQLKAIEADCVQFCDCSLTGDEHLYELAEQHKVLLRRLDANQEQCEQLTSKALDLSLVKESDDLCRAVDSLLNLKHSADAALVKHRKAAGVWAEKGRRTANRGDIKMPVFSGATTDLLTVYEFEKEWNSYKETVNYSVMEALRALKLAVQPPARSAVHKMETEAAIFTYLRAHFGNPVLLLNAREAEIRGWAECKGTHQVRREWLLHAKSRLENTLAMCRDHKIEAYLHFGSITGLVQTKMPYPMQQDFVKYLADFLDPAGLVPKEDMLNHLLAFIDKKIKECTSGLNLDATNFLAGKAAAGVEESTGSSGGYKDLRSRANNNRGGKNNGKNGGGGGGYDGAASGGADGGGGHRSHQAHQQDGGRSQGQYGRSGGGDGGQKKINPRKCVSCNGEHPFLFYCEDYIKANVNDRFNMVKAQKSCIRCLTMGRKFSNKKSEWWAAHDRYCRTTFYCKEGQCAGKPKDRQLHMTVCFTHATENRHTEPDFVKTLDPKELPSGFSTGNLRFLHMLNTASYLCGPGGDGSAPFFDNNGYEVLPDVPDPAIFMLQLLPAELDPTRELLCFYDSGCGAAGISDRGCALLNTTTVRQGPTVLDVAGAKSIVIPYGDEGFCFELDGVKQKATFTGLHMPNITSSFPLFQLTAAWEELKAAATRADRKIVLPEVDAQIGGERVDIILGAKYFKYYPQFVFSLPSGLAVYKARLRSASGCQAVLGGPHAAWSIAAQKTQHMNPRVYLTMEARAWYTEQRWVTINMDKFSKFEQEEYEDESTPSSSISSVLIETPHADGGCNHCHCGEPTVAAIFSAASDEKNLWRVEELGTESPYRCISCRNCSKCRNGEVLEAISFKEEAEQAIIEDSVQLDLDNNKVWATLPFIEDPVIHLQPNRVVAEKILNSQLHLFTKNPSMREDTLKSHKKLVDRGHVIAQAAISKESQAAMDETPGAGYFIPWRTVYKEGSLSTPCRMVFDASSKTPGGNSLNGVLAKGQNRLSKLQHLLIRFRRGRAAVTADITMAYNGTKLRPQHWKYQRYLWKEDLLPENPTIVMIVSTLIYGVKPSGPQCQVSLEKLAEHFLELGQCMGGARALTENTYVDDIMDSEETQQQCEQVADDIQRILAKGSMGVKAFSYAGTAPVEEVSADGVHVSLAGYLWATEKDQLLLDIGPPRLGRAKRGRPSPAVGDDFKMALSQRFTKRTLTGLVASVFDPLGLATPITAGLKLDLHQLCELKLDWDDPVPADLLDKWANNMGTIQQLKTVTFNRTVIPEDAVDTKVELLVATDASQNIGIIAVYGRVLRKNGEYSCQLLVGRSKILSGLTIPKAELKSAVAGAVTASVVRRNLGEQYNGSIFVTDSTICLYWISQDDRPLQVGVRNAVAEIRRFSALQDWYHVESALNVADLGTRRATIPEICPGTSWQQGQQWMSLSRDKMPIKTAAEITLTAEEKRLAAAELRAKDVGGHQVPVHTLTTAVADRYAFSKYLVDPCKQSWTKSVRIMALVIMFTKRCRAAVAARRAHSDDDTREEAAHHQLTTAKQQRELRKIICLSQGDVEEAQLYFFKKGTAEVLHYSKPKDYRTCSKMQNGVLYFTGRLLDSGAVQALEEVMFDLNPVTFCRPMLDRYSPISYSIMLETHWSKVHHLNGTTTYRESLETAFIIRGRELGQEIRENCNFCKRFKARLTEVEMGKVHSSRLAIAPPFTYCQVDLLGPYDASCEHNHRATVKVWGVIFKDPASGAVFVHAMPKYDTSAFVQAYTRFAARFCHPKKLFPDQGSQLMKACAAMEINWLDVSKTLNSKFGVGVEYEPCPVGGHNYHGQVERSVREIKKLFDSIYRGIKLDILGYETAFAYISNELNNLPLCLGTKYKDLDSMDLLTPNRLIHGRANKRAMSGPCTVDKPSKMLEKMGEVFESWWKAWYNEKLADFVAKPPKWLRSDPNIKVGDIVIFQKKNSEQKLGTPIWSIGRVVKADPSTTDDKVREIVIEYKNSDENTFRTTHRAARSVAVLHREEDLDLMQELNQAARAAEVACMQHDLYNDQQTAVTREMEKCESCAAPYICERHSLFFALRPYIYPKWSNADEPAEDRDDYYVAVSVLTNTCAFMGEIEALCAKLKIHEDPWR